MKILIVGDAQHYNALLLKGGLNGHQVQHVTTLNRLEASYELIIDLEFDDHPERAALYSHSRSPVLAGIVKTSLQHVMSNYAFEQGFNIIGCNWLPGFIEMPVTEVSLMDEEQLPQLKEIMAALDWEYELVRDSVGMVTPRVVCMIINEAYMAAEEEIASRSDINTAMKLGTNYPFGPFEWCEKIGIKHVSDVLSSVYASTGNERYKVSALLLEESNVK